MITTTLRKLRKHNACGQSSTDHGYGLLLKNIGPRDDDEPVTLLEILDSNGLGDALWALRACDADRFARLLACDYAEHALPVYERDCPGDNRPRWAIVCARLYATGGATLAELRAARDAAGDAAWVVAGIAAWAAWAVAGTAECTWQEQHLRKLLEDDNAQR